MSDIIEANFRFDWCEVFPGCRDKPFPPKGKVKIYPIPHLLTFKILDEQLRKDFGDNCGHESTFLVPKARRTLRFENGEIKGPWQYEIRNWGEKEDGGPAEIDCYMTTNVDMILTRDKHVAWWQLDFGSPRYVELRRTKDG